MGNIQHQGTLLRGEIIDFNVDLLEDTVRVETQEVHVLLGRGNGIFEISETLYLGFNVGAVSAVDVNGDRILDLLVAEDMIEPLEPSGVSKIKVMIGDGVGGFYDLYTLAVSANISGILGGDFDANGQVPIAIIDAVTNELKIYLR